MILEQLHGIKNNNMKKILISISILISINGIAQSPNDSAYTKNIALQARLVAYLTPLTIDPANDSLHQVFFKWRAALRANPALSGVTTISIDTIPTVELAGMYGYVLKNADGMNVSAIMKPQLTTARAANAYLDRLCTAFETLWANTLANQILVGRKLLLGK